MDESANFVSSFTVIAIISVLGRKTILNLLEKTCRVDMNKVQTG